VNELPGETEPLEGSGESAAASAESAEAPDGASAAAPPSGESAPPPAVAVTAVRSGAGRRLILAALLLPWLLGYGITGSWAVARGALAAADGLDSLQAGYAHIVSPAGLIVVGALLLAGFGALLATALLLAFDRRGRGRWASVCGVAAALTAGSVWAAVAGGLHPGLWLVFFAGLAYAAALSGVGALRAAGARGRGRVERP